MSTLPHAPDRPRPPAEAIHPPYEPKLQTHIPALDAVRGLAILLVTAYRFTDAPAGSSGVGAFLARLLAQGEHGVDLFFVLSGFLITGILYDAKGSRHYFYHFYLRRTLRIFPLYYGVLFLVLVALPLAVPAAADLFAPARQYQVWLWLYGTNILVALKEEWLLGGFNHFWSLAVEEHFYLVWPLVIFLCSRRAALAVCVLVVAVAVVLRTALIRSGQHYAAAEGLTPCRMDALAVGAWLALAVRGPQGVRSLLVPARGLAAGTGAVLVLLFLVDKGLMGLHYTVYAGFFAAMILLAVAARPGGGWERFWHSRLLRICGKYSYGWYVFQGLLVAVVPAALTAESLALRFGSPLAGQFAYLLLGACTSFALALVSWHTYEKHFLKLKDALSRKEHARLG